jgi:uncharacterized membrane protein YhfC
VVHATFLGLNALLMILWPFLIGHYLSRRQRLNWGLSLFGAATFLLSQLAHLPFNRWVLGRQPAWADDLLLLAAFAGLSAGVFEEVARYLAVRFWARETRTWGDGMMFGLGHGGIESVILGALAALNGYVIMNAEGALARSLLPPEQIPVLTATLADLLAQPPAFLLMGAGERLLALTMHLAMTLLVVRAVVNRNRNWLLAAVTAHALFDAVAVYVAQRWGAVWAELALLILALACLRLIIAWRSLPGLSRQSPDSAPTPQPPMPTRVKSDTPSRERLDETRYN